MPKPIQILLIDDHALFRSGVRQLLAGQSDMQVVAEAADGVEGVKRAKEHRPDVILLDLHMPGLSGLASLQVLGQEVPASWVIILTVSEDVQELTHALEHGARGFLIKNIDADTLNTVIRKVAAGRTILADQMTEKLVAQIRNNTMVQQAPASPPVKTEAAPTVWRETLTPREQEIAICLAQGQSNKHIAKTLTVSESTVKIHVQNILRKLNLSSRVQVAVYVVEHGLGKN